jgi:hypothetical protein
MVFPNDTSIKNFIDKNGELSLFTLENVFEIFPKEEIQDLEFDFTCKKLAWRDFEMKLYFGNVHFESNSSFPKQGVTKSILKQLIGLTVQLVDVSKNEIVCSKQIILKDPLFDGVAFNEKRPLSLWIFSDLKLKWLRKYKIRVHFPAINREFPYTPFVLGVGLSYPNYP